MIEVKEGGGVCGLDQQEAFRKHLVAQAVVCGTYDICSLIFLKSQYKFQREDEHCRVIHGDLIVPE